MLTQHNNLEHDVDFNPTNNSKKIIQTKPSTPDHTYKAHKTSESITEQEGSWCTVSTSELVKLYNDCSMETRKLQEMLKIKHSELEYVKSKLNMIKDIVTSLSYEKI